MYNYYYNNNGGIFLAFPFIRHIPIDSFNEPMPMTMKNHPQ